MDGITLPLKVDSYYFPMPDNPNDTYLFYCIVDADNELIASAIEEEDHAKALVCAMNAHEAFVKAVKEIRCKHMIIVDTFGNPARFAYDQLDEGLEIVKEYFNDDVS